ASVFALYGVRRGVVLCGCRAAASQRTTKASEMPATLPGVDVIGEGEGLLLVAVVVLERALDLDVPPLALEIEDLGVDRGIVLVDVLDELPDAAGVDERQLLLVALVLDLDLQALVEEGQLAEPIRQ